MITYSHRNIFLSVNHSLRRWSHRPNGRSSTVRRIVALIPQTVRTVFTIIHDSFVEPIFLRKLSRVLPLTGRFTIRTVPFRRRPPYERSGLCIYSTLMHVVTGRARGSLGDIIYFSSVIGTSLRSVVVVKPFRFLRSEKKQTFSIISSLRDNLASFDRESIWEKVY